MSVYTVTCPACDESFDIEAEAVELADETGCFADCTECGEKEIEFDYDPEANVLTATPGQYEEDEPEEDDCPLCHKPFDDCTCEDDEV